MIFKNASSDQTFIQANHICAAASHWWIGLQSDRFHDGNGGDDNDDDDDDDDDDNDDDDDDDDDKGGKWKWPNKDFRKEYHHFATHADYSGPDSSNDCVAVSKDDANAWVVLSCTSDQAFFICQLGK